MKNRLSILMIFIVLLNLTSVYVPQSVMAGDSYIDVIGVSDNKGDHTFFDNRDCRTNGKQVYQGPGIIMAPKTNILECTRLINYQSPDRTDYIYMERVNPSDDCYFDVPFKIIESAGMEEKKYSYFKLEGDVKIDEFDQYFQFPQIRDNVTAGQNNFVISITTDGSVLSTGGVVASKVIPKGEWFHYLVAINLQSRIVDVYVNGKKVLEAPITNNNIQELYHMRVSLGVGEQLGKVYLDNFDITGLDQPIVDGIETKTNVFASDEAVKDFLNGKIAMHTYGNNIYKNGIKAPFETKGIYDENTEQYYLCADELAKAFDIDLKCANSEITGYVNINKAGEVTLKDGTKVKLEHEPVVSNDTMYVPVRQFAQDVLGKYVWWFKTGILIFTDDRPVKLDTSTWEYQSSRKVGTVTKWNDIDFLNAFLQYSRPDKDRLYNDLWTKSGDNALEQHPRLILTKSDFDLHRKHYHASDDSLYTTLADKYIAEADKYVVDWQVPYKWDDAIRTSVNVSWKFVDKFFALGYAYQLTGDPKYVVAGYKIFEQAATHPDFNLAHIIDTGVTALGLAIGYDWLYDGFTSEQRALARTVVREKCLDRLASGMYGRLIPECAGIPSWHYFKSMNNFNAIITNGVIAASIATLEHDTDEALTYISDAMRSVEYSLQMLPPDGGWNEGVHYWQLNMEAFSVMLDSVDSIFGSTYNLLEGQGMTKTVDYVINCFGLGGINNFGDAVGEVIHSFDTFLYFGRELNNATASKLRYDDLAKTNGVNATMNDILFFDFERDDLNEETSEKFNSMLVTRGTELVSFRDSFDFDKMQTYFSTHFGTTSGYHQHDDCGTFVLDLLGERWVHDLGQSQYNLENELGYKDWQLYRKRAEGHNMIILNPQNYTQSFITTQNEVIPISEAKSNQYGGYVYADMSKAYNKEANSMKLGYYIGDNFKSVTYRNEFNVSKETDVMWSMHTKADIIIDDDNTVYLSQNGKTVRIEVLCKNGTDIKWEDSAPIPLPTSPQVPEQSKEEAFRKLKLTYKAGSGDNVLAIKISSAIDVCSPLTDVPIAEWDLIKITQVGDIVGIPVATAGSNGGLAGKTAQEYAYKLETTSANVRQVVQAQANEGYTFSNSSYVVMDLNVLPTTKDTIIACGPNAGGLYTIKTSAGILHVGKWNNIRLVVENKSEADIKTTQKYQLMTMYVNGVKVGTYASKVLNNDVLYTTPGTYTCANGFRLNLYDTFGATTAYVADIKLTDSDVNEAPVMATIGTYETYAVSDDKITLKQTTTLADVKNASVCDIKLYTDAGMKTEIVDETATLKEGNVLIATDDNKTYSYYSILEHDYIYCCDMSNGIIINDTLSKGAWTCSMTDDGFAGKNDTYTTATGTENCYLQIYYDADASKEGRQLMNKDSAKYVVLSLDVAPDAVSNSDFSIRTVQNNAVIAKSYFASMYTNKWNNVTFVIKNNADEKNASALETIYENSSQAQEAAVHTADLYINGKLVARDVKTGAFGMKYTQDGSTKYGDMLRVYAASSSSKTARFDNVKLYETNTYNTADFYAYPEAVSKSENIVVINDKIIVYNNIAATTDELDFGNGTYTLFNSSMVEKDVNTLENTDVIVLCDGNMIKNYTVVTKNVAPKEDVYTLATLNDFKQACVLTQENDYWTIGTKNGNSYLYQNMDPTKVDYRYYVYEIELKLEDAYSYLVGTSQNYNISNTVLYDNLQLNKNDWNKVVTIFDVETSQSKTYVNGVIVAQKCSSVYNIKDATRNQIRFIFDGLATDDEKAYIKSANVKAYNVLPSAFDDFDVVVDGNYANEEIELIMNPSKCAGNVLIMADFDDDMQSAEYITVSENKNSIKGQIGCMAFLWDDFQNLKPLCGRIDFIFEK